MENSPSNPSPSIPQVHSSLSSRLGGRTMYRGGGVVAGNTQTPIAETNSQPNTRGGFRGSARGRHPNRTLKSGRGGAATIGNNAASGAIYRPPARKFNNVLKNGTPEADFESEDGSTSSPQQSSRFAGIGNFGNKTAQWGVNGKAVSGQVAAFSFLSAAQDQPTSLFQPAVSIPSVLNTSNIIQQTVNYPSALPQHTFPLEEQPQQRPNKFAELQPDRENVRKEYVRLGKMSDGARALKDAITFVGECLDMCPEYERYEREAHNGLDPLERIPGTDFVDHMRAVKRYRRSAAGDPDQMPSDVRPPKILLETLSYLIYDLLGLHGFDKTYTFLRDRQRAIRSDFQLQNYRGPEAVRAFEVMVRYGIMAQHLLSKDAEDVKLKLKQEIDQMNAALKTLIEMYSELGAKGIFFPNEPEFRAYFILVHIWTSEVTVQMERETRPEVFFHPFIQHAVKIQSTVGSRRRSARTTVGFINQFSKFFRLVEKKETTYLMSAICETHFVYIRMAAMRAAIKSYYTIQNKDDTMMDAEELTQLLGFDDGEEVLEYLEFLEIPYEEVNGRIKIQFGKLVVDGKFQNPTIVEFEKVNLSQRQKLNRRIVEHKRESMNLSDVDVVEGKDRLYYNFPGNQSELPQSVVVPPVTRSFPKPIRQNSLSSWNAVPGLPTFQSSSSVLPNSASQSAHFSPKISEPEPTPRLMTTSISIPTSTTPMPVNPSASATTPIPVNPFADVNVQPSQNPKPSFTFKSPSINPEPNLIPSVSFSSSSSTLFPIQTPLTTTSTTNTPNFNLFPTPVQIPTPTTKPTTTLSTESSLLLQQRLAKLNAERQEHENELIVTDVLISLLDSQVEETIIETYESLLATNNLETQKLNDDMSNEIATLIVEETMYETFFELLKEEEWDEIAVEIVEDVVTECITDELGEIGVECEIERMNVEKWFWKWRYSMERSRTEREIDDAKRFKRMRMNQAFEKAKVMNVASIFQGKRNYVKRNRLSFGGSDNQWSRWGDLEGKRKLRMRKIGIEQFVGELGYDGFLKCLVCVNGRDGKDGVMTRWLKSLLRTNNQSVEDGVARYGSNFVEFWGHGIESVETEMRSLVRKSKQVEILIQGVQIADEPRYPLKPNSECACSGPNFAIFSLEVFEGHLSEKT
ncbi:hypothetical protein HK098_006253 [Nowakowskiella sp. JEL0407]|nr:hypothetical protein HK098_006253 [Nowakowskiella sp. JEL0407]